LLCGWQWRQLLLLPLLLPCIALLALKSLLLLLLLVTAWR
jgi:hypothetical protein